MSNIYKTDYKKKKRRIVSFGGKKQPRTEFSRKRKTKSQIG